MKKVYVLIALYLLLSNLAYMQGAYAQQSNQSSKITTSKVTEQQLVDIMTGKAKAKEGQVFIAVQSQPQAGVSNAKSTDDVNRDSSNDVVIEKYSHIGDNFASWISQKLYTANLANGEGKKMLAAELGFTEAETIKFLQVIRKISMDTNKVEKQIFVKRCKRFKEQSKVEGQAAAIESYIDDVRNNIDISEYYHQQLFKFAELYPQLEQDLAYVYEPYLITVTDITPEDYDWLADIKDRCKSYGQ